MKFIFIGILALAGCTAREPAAAETVQILHVCATGDLLVLKHGSRYIRFTPEQSRGDMPVSLLITQGVDPVDVCR